MDRLHPLRVIRFEGREVVGGHAPGVSEADAHTALRSWSYWLDDKGKIQLGLTGTDNYVELRKRRWKNRPDRLVLRCRNSDSTRKYFAAVRGLFDEAGVDYSLELTKKRKSPRALEVTLDPYDPLTAQMALNLARRAFSVTESEDQTFDLSCNGKLRVDAANAPIGFFRPEGSGPPAYELGLRAGRVAREVVDRIGGIE